ncbi:Uncharacterised protein [Bacillus tequilensis]|nr:Uncharacterised protein [Bacillus tequilensis]
MIGDLLLKDSFGTLKDSRSVNVKMASLTSISDTFTMKL